MLQCCINGMLRNQSSSYLTLICFNWEVGRIKLKVNPKTFKFKILLKNFRNPFLIYPLSGSHSLQINFEKCFDKIPFLTQFGKFTKVENIQSEKIKKISFYICFWNSNSFLGDTNNSSTFLDQAQKWEKKNCMEIQIWK